MAKILQNIEVKIDNNSNQKDLLEEKLSILAPNYSQYRILKKSVDARRKSFPHFVYTIEIAESGEVLNPITMDMPKSGEQISEKPIIIGAGPGGLFAALRLVERGIPCRLFERGSQAEKRIMGINQFWRYGKFDARNNVCFGEGGAGLYSDGKLITRIKSPHIPYVLNRLVQFGAPDEIQYLSNPHVGSDRIRRLIPKIRQYLIDNGCEIYFDTQVTELLCNENSDNQIIGIKTEKNEFFYSSFVVLATGHSAEDMLIHLQQKNVFLEGKSFAMGLRIEHPQSMINQIQYREYSNNSDLGAANYKLAYTDPNTEIGTYSFCMCPGGFVLNATTDSAYTVCNGMSNYNRNSPFANAAIVVSINHEKLFGSDILGGLKYRSQLEKSAQKSVAHFYQKNNLSEFEQNKQRLPGQKLIDFIEGRSTPELLKNSSLSGAVPANLHQILPKEIYKNMLEGFQQFNKNMRGFINDQAQLFGVESRTSCPVRVTRDKISLESVSHPGLFPCGEGAGYAGGITSAACDGVRIAEKIAAKVLSKFEDVEF